MNDAFQILNNIRTLRAQAREIPINELEELLEKLTIVVNERREKREAEEAQNRKKEEKLTKYREMLIADGIDPNELMDMLDINKKRSRRTPRPAKYYYTNENG